MRTIGGCGAAADCRALCARAPNCSAWTWVAQAECRLKRRAERSIQVVSTAPCFQPNYPGSHPPSSVSGFMPTAAGVRFAQVYVNRTKAWIAPEPAGRHWLGNWSIMPGLDGVEPIVTADAAPCADLGTNGDATSLCGQHCR